MSAFLGSTFVCFCQRRGVGAAPGHGLRSARRRSAADEGGGVAEGGGAEGWGGMVGSLFVVVGCVDTVLENGGREGGHFPARGDRFATQGKPWWQIAQ